MNDALQYALIAFYYCLPYLIALGAAFVMLGLGVVGIKRPRLLVYPILLIMFTMGSNSFGTIDFADRSIYSRGSGQLFYPLILWAVLLGLIWNVVAQFFMARPRLACNIRPWIWCWSALLAAHVAVGLLLDVDASEILSGFGLANIVWMGFFVLFVVNGFTGERDAKELTSLIILVALGRTLFGLVRWAVFKGDPANIYANFEQINVKLTFFDINDSLVCLFGFAAALMRLSRAKELALSKVWLALCWLTVLLAPACIALSYRRTAWLGFVTASALALVFLTPRQRLVSLLTAVPLTLVGLAVVAARRLSQTRGAGGLSDMFYDLQGSSTGALNERQLELVLAWRDFVNHPLAGLGAWGRYHGSGLIEWQQGAGDGAFLHSGILHVALKSGLIGLTLLAGLLGAFAGFVWRNRNKIDAERLPLFVAGASGALLMLPDMVAGTPIPQVRTMLMWGLCLALPYVALRRVDKHVEVRNWSYPTVTLMSYTPLKRI